MFEDEAATAEAPLVPMRLVFELIAATTAPSQARALANGLAPDLRPGILADLRIVISELVANAVKQGPGSPIHVELDVRTPTACASSTA